jgi:hypothetical protein
MAKVQMGNAEEADGAVQVLNNTILNGSLLVVLKESEFNARQGLLSPSNRPWIDSLTCGLLIRFCFRSA